jgi:hypothetical protein
MGLESEGGRGADTVDSWHQTLFSASDSSLGEDVVPGDASARGEEGALIFKPWVAIATARGVVGLLIGVRLLAEEEGVSGSSVRRRDGRPGRRRGSGGGRPPASESVSVSVVG